MADPTYTIPLALQRKLDAVDVVASMVQAPEDMRCHAHRKTIVGHYDHRDDAQTLSIGNEIRDELADLLGYPALALWRGEWSWRLRVVAWLAAVAWRVLGGQ